MTRTLKELAQESLDIQNASNLSGIVHSFSRAITELREVASGSYSNVHPINLLWADKIAHLTGTQDIGNSKIFKAYNAIADFLEGKITEKQLNDTRVSCDATEIAVGVKITNAIVDELIKGGE